MSRIGRLPIPVPAGVDVTLEGTSITVRGPRGELHRDLVPELRLVRDGDLLRVERPRDDKRSRQLHGLTRTLVANMVIGVTDGYRRQLEITGVGYRAQKIGDNLQLSLGYSHPVEMMPPAGVSFEVETPTRLAVVGIDKELVGHVAARVRSMRKPEPYKGKGVRYKDEVVRRKSGKSFGS
jgi:large subunit ribosomal protein L6